MKSLICFILIRLVLVACIEFVFDHLSLVVMDVLEIAAMLAVVIAVPILLYKGSAGDTEEEFVFYNP